MAFVCDFIAILFTLDLGGRIGRQKTMSKDYFIKRTIQLTQDPDQGIKEAAKIIFHKVIQDIINGEEIGYLQKGSDINSPFEWRFDMHLNVDTGSADPQITLFIPGSPEAGGKA
jgi:hypothetical protein